MNCCAQLWRGGGGCQGVILLGASGKAGGANNCSQGQCQLNQHMRCPRRHLHTWGWWRRRGLLRWLAFDQVNGALVHYTIALQSAVVLQYFTPIDEPLLCSSNGVTLLHDDEMRVDMCMCMCMCMCVRMRMRMRMRICMHDPTSCGSTTAV